MEIYYTDSTYPPLDILLTREDENGDDVYVDPSGADEIEIIARISGIHDIQLSANLSNNVSVVVDSDGKNRVRIRFVTDDLDIAGIYRLLTRLIWPDGRETIADQHEFKVLEKWD